MQGGLPRSPLTLRPHLQEVTRGGCLHCFCQIPSLSPAAHTTTAWEEEIYTRHLTSGNTRAGVVTGGTPAHTTACPSLRGRGAALSPHTSLHCLRGCSSLTRKEDSHHTRLPVHLSGTHMPPGGLTLPYLLPISPPLGPLEVSGPFSLSPHLCPRGACLPSHSGWSGRATLPTSHHTHIWEVEF